MQLIISCCSRFLGLIHFFVHTRAKRGKHDSRSLAASSSSVSFLNATEQKKSRGQERRKEVERKYVRSLLLLLATVFSLESLENEDRSVAHICQDGNTSFFLESLESKERSVAWMSIWYIPALARSY